MQEPAADDQRVQTPNPLNPHPIRVTPPQLRLLAEERASEIEVLRNKLEQRDASIDVLKRNYTEQVQG